MYYAGIGSRKTPSHVIEYMTRIAGILNDKGFILRSGGASGADTAFSNGASRKHIYIPWPGFSGLMPGVKSTHDAVIVLNSTVLGRHAYNIASKIHPSWDKCTETVRALHTRNVFQVKGHSNNNQFGQRVEFVVYWSKYDDWGNPKGGTATAVNLAKRLKIPCYNLNIPMQLEEFNDFINSL